MELKLKFHESKLKKGGDPDEWISKLERLSWRLESNFKSGIEEEDVMIHIINNLTLEYEDVIISLEWQINSKVDTLTLDSLKEQLRSKFQRLKKMTGSKNSDERGLVVSGKTFKWACRNCGKIGHKAADCKAPKKKKVNFTYCKRDGHEEEKCYKKAWDESKKEDNNDAVKNSKAETAMLTVEDQKALMSAGSIEADSWIADTGASTHMVNSKEFIFNLRSKNATVSVGNGQRANINLMGDLKGKILNSDGSKHEVMLKDVSYVPSMCCNLYSLTTAIGKGFSLGNKGRMITLEKEGLRFDFVEEFKMESGFLWGLKLELEKANEINYVAHQKKDEVKTILNLHEMLGHPGKEALRNTVKDLGIEIKNEDEVCEACCKAKARQKDLNKKVEVKADLPGKHLYADIIWITKESLGGKSFWILVVDENTNMMWSKFVHRKK